MKNIELYEMGLWNATGIYTEEQGQADEARAGMVELANVLNTLEQMGFYVQRYSLSNNPRAFLSNPIVSHMIQSSGDEGFPCLFIDDEPMLDGRYPTMAEWAEWCEVPDLADQLVPLSQDELDELNGVDCAPSAGCGGCTGCASGY